MKSTMLIAVLAFAVPLSAQTFRPRPNTRATERAMENASSLNRSGILECDVSWQHCTVMNMPRLWQADPRIDKDAAVMEPYGCYDTAITSIVLAALANREPSLEPNGRTEYLINIGKNSPNMFPDIPPAIKQLSQVYVWAFWNHGPGVTKPQGQPFFVHEVVANFGPIKETCDPMTYRKCTTATNDVASAFMRRTNGDLADAEILKLMKDGYAVLIAFDRFHPNVKGGHVSFDAVGPVVDGHHVNDHKVVFSGFTTGKYPLLVNDVGSGKLRHARLTNDIASYGVPPGASVQYPMPSHTVLEYEDEPHVNAFFVEEIDGIRIAPANPNSFPAK